MHQSKRKRCFCLHGLERGADRRLEFFWGHVELGSRGHIWMDIITHLISKGTTALLFSPGDTLFSLLHLLHRAPPHTDPNTGRKMIKKYPELAKFQISYQVALDAAGVALIASLTHCWELICPLPFCGLWNSSRHATDLVFHTVSGHLCQNLHSWGFMGFFPVRRGMLGMWSSAQLHLQTSLPARWSC